MTYNICDVEGYYIVRELKRGRYSVRQGRNGIVISGDLTKRQATALAHRLNYPSGIKIAWPPRGSVMKLDLDLLGAMVKGWLIGLAIVGIALTIWAIIGF